jgi:hypothetical protein
MAYFDIFVLRCPVKSVKPRGVGEILNFEPSEASNGAKRISTPNRQKNTPRKKSTVR